LKAGLLPDRLIADLQALADAADRDAPDSTPALIDHILNRYHETHRAELEWLIPLAQKVERVHGDHEEAPLGSSLINFHSQNSTVAARAMAERKTIGQRSYRVATRRQSLSLPNMISMRLRRL
jgi:iron-sulfur cluster repair protein YtfE (RIC family)